MCGSTKMKFFDDIPLGRMQESMLHEPGYLEERENELNRRLLESPGAMSQRIENELIDRLRVNAPWLIQLIAK